MLSVVKLVCMQKMGERQIIQSLIPKCFSLRELKKHHRNRIKLKNRSKVKSSMSRVAVSDCSYDLYSYDTN